jgi:hypothetical protein
VIFDHRDRGNRRDCDLIKKSRGMIPRSTDFFDRVLYLVRRYAIDRQLSEIACHQIPVWYRIHPNVLFAHPTESNA